MKQIAKWVGVALMGVVLAGCASSGNGNASVYSPGQVMRPQTVEYGSVVGVRAVTVEGDNGIGSTAGAVVGGIIGNQIGHGAGRSLGTIAGVLIGSGVGSSVAKAGSRYDAQEVVVRRAYDTISVVQGLEQQFYPGDRVMIHYTGQGVRLSRY